MIQLIVHFFQQYCANLAHWEDKNGGEKNPTIFEQQSSTIKFKLKCISVVFYVQGMINGVFG